MNRITRKEAAELLGVSIQTITNYVNQGLLGGFKGEKGIQYVNADDVEAYASKYKFITVSQQLLDRKLSELEQARRQVDEEMAELRRNLVGNLPKYLGEEVCSAISAVYEAGFVPGMKQRECDILCSCIKGEELKSIAQRYHLTRERVRQVVVKACRRISTHTDDLRTNIRTNRELRSEVAMLKSSLTTLRSDFNIYRAEREETLLSENDTQEPAITRTLLTDLNFSVRLQNALAREQITTLGELLTKYTPDTLAKLRSLGKKSLIEIRDFLDERGLSFKRGNESLTQYYVRLNLSLKIASGVGVCPFQ